MSRPSWPLLWMLALAACSRPHVQAPASTRLIQDLSEALEVPPVPAPKELLRLDALVAPARTIAWGIPVEVESDRGLLVRARLKRHGAAQASVTLFSLTAEQRAAWGLQPKGSSGPPPGKRLGACMESSRTSASVQCQLFFHLDARAQAVLLWVERPELGVERLELLDGELRDARPPGGPRLSPLVRRAPATTDAGGVSWRSGLVARPGGRYVFPLDVPEPATLVLATGHERGDAGGPVRFVVQQDGATLLDEVVKPDKHWHEHRLELRAQRGRTSTLSLEAFAVQGASGEPRGLWGAPRVIRSSSAPSILLVTVDALRPDHLSAYGYGRDTSPTLEHFGQSATRFDRATAQATRTWESLSSLLTGRYPANSRVRNRGVPIPADIPTLAELFSARGFDTFAGGDVALFPLESFSSFDEEEMAPKPELAHYSTLAQFRPWAQRMAKGPVFAWLHLEHPHYALVPLEPRRYNPGYEGAFQERLTLAEHSSHEGQGSVSAAEQQQIIALYDASIRDADREILGLLRELEEAGALEKTIVVVTADHGENLGEHGVALEHLLPYDAVLHVPLFIAWPGQLKGGRSVKERVQLVDLAPTLLSLAGLKVPDDLDGRDLSPALRGEHLPELPSYAEFECRVFSQYRGDHHLILNPGARPVAIGGIPSPTVPIEAQSLYRLDADPGELHDVLRDPAAGVGQDKALLEAKMEAWRRSAAGMEPERMGQAALNVLMQAGYLQAPAEPPPAP